MTLSAPSLSAELTNLLEEYAARLQAGEAVDLEEFVAAHPAHAELLRKLLPTMRVLAELGSSPGGGTAGRDEHAGTLGDYRIIREVGRGGMGVVYEAEQISLRRRVALKVLPFAATMDPRQLQRFHNEAQAAASLHHEHIVPVHGVGCERSTHFYAMQFVDGVTLAQVISRRGEPSNGDPATPHLTTVAFAATTRPETADRAYHRQVVEWGVQAALALEHAHAMGIVHRDVKPGNLMIDGRGKLWVTDFGLARTGQGDLTMSGDLVGTLRYMSPEQALGKHGLVDHRSDIYSLGATLYELLTGVPAVGGQDREEILRRIAFEEPRSLSGAVPRDLETVVLKALAKEPAARYATAQELADDLRHFLEDRPVKARRPSLAQRLTRLARRHRAVVTTAALGLILAVTALAGSVGWVLRDRSLRGTDANRKLTEELAFLEAGLDRLDNPHDKAMVAAAEQIEAQLATGLVDPSLRHRAEQTLLDRDTLAELEQSYLQQSLGINSRFVPDDPDNKYARAFRSLGIDVRALGVDEAAALVRSRSIRVALASALDGWAAALVRAGRPDAARRLVAVAERADPDEGRNRLRQALLANDVAGLVELGRSARPGKLPAITLRLLGLLLTERGQAGLAVDFLLEAQRRQPGDYWINSALASALGRTRPPRLEEAATYHRIAIALRPQHGAPRSHLVRVLVAQKKWGEAVALGREATELAPDDPIGHNNLSGALLGQRKIDEAMGAARTAIRLRPEYAMAHYNLGVILEQKGHGDQAIACYREAIRLAPGYAHAHANLGIALAERGKWDEGTACMREAIRLAPEDPQTHDILGVALVMQGKSEEAVPCFRQAIRVDPGYVEAHHNLGVALRGLGRRDEAIASFREFVRLQPANAGVHGTLGELLYRAGNYREAAEALARAVELSKGSRLSAAFFLAMTHARLGRMEEARRLYEQTAAAMEKSKIKDRNVQQARAEAAVLLGIKEPALQKGAPTPK